MLNQILIATRDFVDVSLNVLVAKGETVKCVSFDEPNIGTIYTLKLQQFGKDAETELKLDANGLMYLEPANKELRDVLDWYFSLYNDVRATTPEYFDQCYDRNAVEYLHDEARGIYNRLEAKTEAAMY